MYILTSQAPGEPEETQRFCNYADANTAFVRLCYLEPETTVRVTATGSDLVVMERIPQGSESYVGVEPQGR